jgi:hypothetical protein
VASISPSSTASLKSLSCSNSVRSSSVPLAISAQRKV